MQQNASIGSDRTHRLIAVGVTLLLLWNTVVPGQEDAGGPMLRSSPFRLSTEDRSWWSFQPVRRPILPRAQPAQDRAHPVDQLIWHRLAREGITQNPEAPRRQLIRRLFLDVIGLPPTPEEMESMVGDDLPGAWERWVDKLLASPHFGERWARHWLDLVRYAESNGYERDGAKPHAWRYRDYVIRSFNQDKPYDQFIREQIAGDEIADASLASAAATGDSWKDAIVATGFYRLHVWDDEPDSSLAAEFDDLDDVVVTTGTAFLGLTIGCARCHDHKYDPVSHRDYYSFLAYLRNIDPYGLHHTGGGGRGNGRITRPLATPAEVAAWESARRRRIEEAEAGVKAASDAESRKPLEEALRRIREEAAPYEVALAVAETGPRPKPTQVLLRGRADTPGDEVEPGFPEALGLSKDALPGAAAGAASSGRRSVLAQWITHPANPLTARVMVNRIWQHYFGVGIVPSPDDFGRTGLAPTHPELLDHLAAELVEGGWSLKKIHRHILTSASYRMSSATLNGTGKNKDESNRMLWRQNLRRVESEVIRDSMLAISGQLNRKMGGPSVYPTLVKEVHGTQDSVGKGWGESPVEEQNRRSIYLVVKRALKLPFLESFDFANCASPVGQRPVTTIAPQALMGLNDPFMESQARALAVRVSQEGGAELPGQVVRVFQLALQRAPDENELQSSLRMLADQQQQGLASGQGQPEAGALTSFCLSILNLNEVIYAD